MAQRPARLPVHLVDDLLSGYAVSGITISASGSDHEVIDISYLFI